MLADSGNPPGGKACVTIELHDRDAGVFVAKVTLTPEQWVSAMSRLGYVECEIEIGALDKIGKRMENKPFEFAIGNRAMKWNTVKPIAIQKIAEVCPVGWTPDTYFGSQNSFFYKDGQQWARTTIRRWV